MSAATRKAVRHAILKDNHARQAGRKPVRRLDDGEVVFKIPKQDMKVLARLFPELVSKNHATRLAAWKQLRNSPIGEQYLVTRTPRQVKANQNRIIVR